VGGLNFILSWKRKFWDFNIYTKGFIALAAMKMRMLVSVFFLVASFITQCEFGSTRAIKGLVNDARLLKCFQRSIQGDSVQPLHFVFYAALGKRFSRFQKDFQNIYPILGYPYVFGSQNIFKDIAIFHIKAYFLQRYKQFEQAPLGVGRPSLPQIFVWPWVRVNIH
jgi:hypothetical protein